VWERIIINCKLNSLYTDVCVLVFLVIIGGHLCFYGMNSCYYVVVTDRRVLCCLDSLGDVQVQ
jgi:hypothetical protein